MAYQLRNTVTRIGRHPESDIVVSGSYKAVSRHHAEIRREGSQYVVYDTSSTSTRVNGQRVQRHFLQDGDRITLGGEAEFVFSRGVLYDARNSPPAVQPTRLEPARDYYPSQRSAANRSAGDRPYGEKNRITAAILAILLGDIGAHKFYLGKTAEGILYLLLCWTGIPALVGLVEGIIYLSMSDADFAYRYG